MTSNKSDASNKSEVWGFIIERTARRMKQAFKRTLKAANVGVTVDQWIILQFLNDRNGSSQFEIAKETYKDAPTVTRIIDLLCGKDLTTRKADAVDRRKFNIWLTEKGKNKIKEIVPIVKKFRKHSWKGLSEQELDHMVTGLNKIFYNLETEKK